MVEGRGTVAACLPCWKSQVQENYQDYEKQIHELKNNLSRVAGVAQGALNVLGMSPWTYETFRHIDIVARTGHSCAITQAREKGAGYMPDIWCATCSPRKKV